MTNSAERLKTQQQRLEVLSVLIKALNGSKLNKDADLEAFVVLHFEDTDLKKLAKFSLIAAFISHPVITTEVLEGMLTATENLIKKLESVPSEEEGKPGEYEKKVNRQASRADKSPFGSYVEHLTRNQRGDHQRDRSTY